MRRILVITEPLAYGRDVFAGVARAARAQADWRLEVLSWLGTEESRPLALAGIDGVVGLIRSEGRVAQLRMAGVPAVNCSTAVRIDGLPAVHVDDHALGRLAAEHLLACGLRHLAFVDGPRHFCLARGAGMRARATEDGVAVTTLLRGPRFADELAALAAAGPLGVFAYNDFTAHDVHDACRLRGLRVPHDVAILGADDDRAVCESCDPPLSSICTPGEAVGAAAGELLARLLAGGSAPASPALVAPQRVAVRASTDLVAAGDPVVAAAMRWMRAHAAKPVDAGDVAGALALSRSSLERRFRRALGHGPGGELRRLRVRLAQEMLVGSELPVRAVARLAGFASHARLCAAFARATGMSPSAWRARCGTREVAGTAG